MLCRIVFVVMCFMMSCAQAAALPEFNSRLLQQRSTDILWLKLMHYERDVSTRSGYLGAIKHPDFYLDENGRSDPIAELSATLTAFYAEDSSNDLHAQCRFPARYLWFKRWAPKQLTLPASVPCKAYEDWSEGENFQSISIVYVTGYLGNPASFYGHTFLKFNTAQKRSHDLDKTINFGAIVPDAENPITYILKGVFGGYDGGFSEVGYYFHTNNYGDNELRDMWEYELNVSAEDTALMAAHAWEILKKEYTYFFFKKNCAYRMAEIVELATGVNILDDKPVTIPQSLITAVHHASVKGQPLVKTMVYRPSRQSRLYDKYASLSAREKKLLHELVDDPKLLENDSYKHEPVASQQRVIETLLDYLQISRELEDRASNKINAFYQRALVERYRLPVGKASFVTASTAAPHEGRAPSLVQVGLRHNSAQGDGLLFRLRPAYYDVLDADKSHVADSVLSMGSAELLVEDSTVSLKRLSLIDLESVNAAVTGLPGDNGQSWKLNILIEPLDLRCDDCMAFKTQAYYGQSKRLTPHLLVGGYLGGVVQDNVSHNANVELAVRAFTNVTTGHRLSGTFFVESLTAVDNDASSRYKLGAELRAALSKVTDIRLVYDHDQAEELSLKLGFYF